MPSTLHNKPLTSEELKRIRKHAGLTQSELAKQFGLSDSRVIRRYEAGKKPPPGPVQKLYQLLRDGKLLVKSGIRLQEKAQRKGVSRKRRRTS